MTGDRTCYDCTNCLIVEEGYSNYTVTGTEVFCVVDAHPSPGWDKWYKVMPNDNGHFAKECAQFTPGDAGVLDVEREDLAYLPPLHRQWLNAEWGVPL